MFNVTRESSRRFFLLVLSSADLLTWRTTRVWVPPAPKWWWPKPMWSPWTAKAGGKPYSVAPAWSTTPPGGREVSSDSPAQRGGHRGPLQGTRRHRIRDRWTEWGGGGWRRAWRGTRMDQRGGKEHNRDQNVTITMSLLSHRLSTHCPLLTC